MCDWIQAALHVVKPLSYTGLARKQIVYLSFTESDAQAEASKLYNQIIECIPPERVSRESMNKFNTGVLFEWLKKANNVVVVLSANYPKRRFNMLELHYALRCGANVSAVRVEREGEERFDEQQVQTDIESGVISSYLTQRGWGLLQQHGITMHDVVTSLLQIIEISHREVRVDPLHQAIGVEATNDIANSESSGARVDRLHEATSAKATSYNANFESGQFEI